MKRGFLDASWTLVGITVGAGILGLPFILQRAGFLTGLLIIFLVGIFMAIITLYLGEIVLRTRGKHQLTGYAGKYLGSTGKWLMFFANSLSIYGALTAYVIGAGKSLTAIFLGDSFFYSLIFLIFFSIIVYFGITTLANMESFLSPLKILVAVILSIILLPFIDIANITEFSIYNILLPYGVVVFALTGISAIPIMSEELSNKKEMFKAIITGMLITILIYILFSFSIVGSLGSYVNEVATVSLYRFGSFVNILSNLFAFLAMSTAFLALSYALKENYNFDLKLNNFTSWILVIFFPLVIFLLDIAGFIKILEVTGAVAIGFILVLLILIHGKAVKYSERIPEYCMPKNLFLKAIIVGILLIGILYEIFSVLGF